MWEAATLRRSASGTRPRGVEPKEAREVARLNFLGSPTPGKTIDDGIYITLFAIALGALAEISFQIKRVLEKL
jgi:hypothetical protein